MKYSGKDTFGRYYEEFSKGDCLEHWPGKTITEAECAQFSLLTMNHHPLHFDRHFAGQSQHGRILVVGTLVFSLVVGQSVRDISGKAIANLEYTKIVHHGPCFCGDTVYSHSEVLDVIESRSKKDRGVVHVKTEGFNQKRECILSFERKVLVPKRDVAG